MRVNYYSLILMIILVSPLPLAVLHSGTTEAPILHSQAVIADEPFFVRGPTINLVTNESALVFWRTEGMTNATVRYGLNESVIESVVNTTLDTDHRIGLAGLNIDSKYYYKVSSNNIESPVYHFRTAPPAGEEFKMIVIGDNRPTSVSYIQPDEFKQLAQLIIAEEPHLVVMTGDYVLDVSTDDAYNLAGWKAFTNISDQIGHYAPIYGALGNHDTGAKTGTLRLEYYFDAFIHFNESSTYFSFDYAGAHFSIVDTEEQYREGRITGAQYSWLVNDLNSTNCATKYVVGHRPMYPLSHLGDSIDSNPTERARLQQLFEDNNVTAYICGHDHLFDRITVNGLVHLISGGGGAPPYDTFWGDAYYHYMRIGSSYSLVNMSTIKLDGQVGYNYQLPYLGPLEIAIRVLGNGSTAQAGSLPEIYFSEEPTQVYYSWDSEDNQTELTGLPGVNGQHTLDVYAVASDDVWSHARFVLTTVGVAPTTTTTTSFSIDPLLLGGIAIAGIVVVVIIVFAIRRRQ